MQYPKNVSFECQRCGKCCGDVSRKKRKILLLKSEVKRISDITGLKEDGFATRLQNDGPYRYMMKKKGGKCVFLERNSCKIYPLRPLICRSYPFSVEKTRSKDFIFKVSDECPGIGLGDTVEEDHFERILSEAQTKLKSR